MPRKRGAKRREAVERRKWYEIEKAQEKIYKRDGRGERDCRLVQTDYWRETNYKAEDNSEKNVCGAAGDGDERLAPAMVLKVERIIWHRLGPAE